MEPTYYLPATSEVMRGTYADFDVVAVHMTLVAATPDGEPLDIIVLFDSDDSMAMGNDLVDHSLTVTPLQEQPAPGIVEPEATSEEDNEA